MNSVPSFMRLMIMMLFAFMLAACQDTGQAPLIPGALVGTKAIMKANGRDLILKVTDVADKIVVTALYDWNNELVSKRHYYRGLYPISGAQGTEQWETDFDSQKLEDFFPLVIGKKTSFQGNMIDIASGASYAFRAHLNVIKEIPFSLSDSTCKVFVVEIRTEYEWQGKKAENLETVYYSPDFSMNLKGVLDNGRSQRFWRIVSVERPGESKMQAPLRQRSSGTVLI